jgi:hypothetical protein
MTTLKFYWICYRELNYLAKGGTEKEMVINVHPFIYVRNSVYGRVLINWKEITEDEFELFIGEKELLSADYNPIARTEAINKRLSSYDNY